MAHPGRRGRVGLGPGGAAGSPAALRRFRSLGVSLRQHRPFSPVAPGRRAPPRAGALRRCWARTARSPWAARPGSGSRRSGSARGSRGLQVLLLPRGSSLARPQRPELRPERGRRSAGPAPRSLATPRAPSPALLSPARGGNLGPFRGRAALFRVGTTADPVTLLFKGWSLCPGGDQRCVSLGPGLPPLRVELAERT